MKLISVGDRIKYIRTQKKLTLEQLADKAEISKSFLWDIENDRSDIGGEKLLRIANVLGASLDYLLRGEPISEGTKPSIIEIPVELSNLAEEKYLSYQQTLLLLEIDTSIMARRSTKNKDSKTKEYWQELYEGVKPFLGERK
ncbi:helix-turn-helix domain-containing protein [bacterium]|nr:helix-turn-helix domain-containing protein [bacterium]